MSERTNAAELIASFTREASDARRQWANWLGVGAGGGVVALLSFAANLPAPDHALYVLMPAIAAFVLAIICAAPALLMQAAESANAALYYSEVHNADELRAAAHAMPQHIAAPQALADRLNAPRNQRLARAEGHDGNAETAWKERTIWKWFRRVLMTGSALAFVAGASYPLYLIWARVPLAPQAEQKATPVITNERSRASLPGAASSALSPTE